MEGGGHCRSNKRKRDEKDKEARRKVHGSQSSLKNSRMDLDSAQSVAPSSGAGPTREEFDEMQQEVKKLRGEVAMLRNAMRMNRLLSIAEATGDKELDLSSQGYDSSELPNFDECLHGYLGSITSLDLANNYLTKFPIGLSSLPALGELCLSHNLIEEVPRSIGLLTNLRTLLLNNNRLRDLGEGIRMLSNLQDLVITNNQETLHYLPEGFRVMLRYEVLVRRRMPLFDKKRFVKEVAGVFYAFPSLVDICCTVVAGLRPLSQLDQLPEEEKAKPSTTTTTTAEEMHIDGEEGDEERDEEGGEGDEGEEGEGDEEEEEEEEDNSVFDDDDPYYGDEEEDDDELDGNLLPDRSFGRGAFRLFADDDVEVQEGFDEDQLKEEILEDMKEDHDLSTLPVELSELLIKGVRDWSTCSLCARRIFGRPRVTKVSKMEYFAQKLLLKGVYCSVLCYRTDQEVIRRWHYQQPEVQQAEAVEGQQQGQQQQPAQQPQQPAQEQQQVAEDNAATVAPTTSAAPERIPLVDNVFIEQHPSVTDAIEKGTCTFNNTGRKFRGHARMWRCFTCGLVGNDPQEGAACCDSCAKVCHAGHNVAEVIVLGDWFCDCGAGLKDQNCILLNEDGKRKRQEDKMPDEDAEDSDD